MIVKTSVGTLITVFKHKLVRTSGVMERDTHTFVIRALDIHPSGQNDPGSGGWGKSELTARYYGSKQADGFNNLSNIKNIDVDPISSLLIKEREHQFQHVLKFYFLTWPLHFSLAVGVTWVISAHLVIFSCSNTSAFFSRDTIF